MWLEIANEILMKSHRSTAFLEAQRQLLRAGMDFLLAERKLVEQLVEPAGLPTRSELAELHHTVHTLKRRVRALEKARHSEGRSSARTAAPRPRRSTTNRGAGGKR
jgi:polyhydroxyalkanoate synthase subunit PhaE